jgi:peptidoglycan/xylan/chitin deacetylase (PgdA/CDA1 family)
VRGKTARTWRETLANGMYYSGALAVLRRVARGYELQTTAGRLSWPRSAGPRFAILCYHRVGVEDVPIYSRLQPQVFDSQMKYLRRHYRLLSLKDMLGEMARPTSSVPAVAVTFDDGYRGVFEYAFPVLRKYDIPATVFAVADSIETGTAPWYDRIFLALSIHPEPALTIELDEPTKFSLESAEARLAATDGIVRWLRTQPDWRRREFCSDLNRRLPVPEEKLENRMLNWEQLRTMQAHDVVCGSHTLSHPVLSQVDRENLLRELRDSRIALERQLGCPVKDFAFPFGKPSDCAGITDADLASCGYRSAATTLSGTNRPGANPYHLRRVSVDEQPDLPLFAYRLNSLFLRSDDSPTVSSSADAAGIPAAMALARRKGG